MVVQIVFEDAKLSYVMVRCDTPFSHQDLAVQAMET